MCEGRGIELCLMRECDGFFCVLERCSHLFECVFFGEGGVGLLKCLRVNNLISTVLTPFMFSFHHTSLLFYLPSYVSLTKIRYSPFSSRKSHKKL